MPLPTEGNAVTSQKTAEFGSAASSVKPIDSHARFIVVGVIVVGSFIALLNQTVMSPALPALMRDFNITTGTVQWVTSVYMLVSGIMVPISGYLIDKFSTRKLFAGALATFMVGHTAVCRRAEFRAVARRTHTAIRRLRRAVAIGRRSADARLSAG